MTTKQHATNRWSEIFAHFGIGGDWMNGRHCPCPVCGGKDRFRYDNKGGNGTYWCNGCGNGDGFDLVSELLGISAKETFARINLFLDIKPTFVPNDQDHANRMMIKRIWEASQRPVEGGAVHTYLKHRTGFLWPSNAIREYVSDRQTMMVSKIITHDDKAVNVHLTYLNPDGTKRVVEGQPTKRVMAGKLPEGSAIRLMPAAKVMGIAEGIETALSASRMFSMPVWSVINGTMLAKWRPPEIAEYIIVFGDHDKNFAGHAKAYAAANRLYTQFARQVEVRIPDQVGDWNDVWSTDQGH